MQICVERRLLKVEKMVDFLKAEFRKFLDLGAISRISQEELDVYEGPLSYVTHLPVLKFELKTTPLRIVTDSSFDNKHT